MSLSLNLWQIKNENLIPMNTITLNLEKRLESWIVQDISLLGIDAFIIGRQVHTNYGGYIDLMAINGDGELIIIELKRNKTPRDIVAQCLDYATWVYDLKYNDIVEIYKSYKTTDFNKDFAEFFDTPVPEKINTSYQIVIVAESLDDSTERIVQHLNEVHNMNINAIFFNIFSIDGNEYIGRSWLKDPVDVEEKSVTGRKPMATGYLFANTGITDDNSRNWNLNVKYNFISAGGGPRWINAIKKLNAGDKIFAYIKGKGYVGYGIVEEPAVLVKNYSVDGKLMIDDLPADHAWRQAKDPSVDEWIAKVKWLKKFDEKDAKSFKGVFANQNIVCQLRDQNTFKFLVENFEVDTTIL